MEKHVIAVDIGGTKIAGALVTADGRLMEKRIISTPVASAKVVAEAVRTLVVELYQSGKRQAVAVGIGTAGQVDVDKGMITYAVDTLPGWAGIPLKQLISETLPLPIIIENDVNAMAAGELSADSDVPSALFVAVGTGIGGALVVDGKLWHGVNWSAGEIGHLMVDYQGKRRCTCGRYGHLEAYTSGPAIAQAYDPNLDLRTVVAKAHEDSQARAVIAEGAHILGSTLSGLLCAFDPGLLIIGGGVPEIGALWWHPFTEALRENPLPAVQRTEVRGTRLGIDAVLVGAAALAWEQVTVR
jgi:glucokinase